jgi:NAD-dependent deacetylase
VWEWYQERRQKIRDSKPNPAHLALVELASNCTDFLLVTQNVDDLHEQAKHEKLTLKKEQIVHIHGEIFRSRCMTTGCNFERWDRQPPAQGDPQCPRCPNCGSFLRPGVVWFDEDNDPNEENRVDAFLDNGRCNVVLVIGTTATFDYIRRWVLQAVVGGAWLIEVNPHETPLSRFAHHVVRKRAAKVLPDMVRDAVEHGPLSIG